MSRGQSLNNEHALEISMHKNVMRRLTNYNRIVLRETPLNVNYDPSLLGLLFLLFCLA